MTNKIPRTIIIPGPGLWSIAFALVGLTLLSYTYFLASSVVYVAATKGLVRDIASVNSSIGSLESSYLLALNELKEEDISKHGLTRITSKYYVSSPDFALSLVR